MYTTPATTVGLASRAGAGLPLITGGCQCHTWCAEAAFDGVNAVALLTELCCGPCSYCGQSRFGARACLAAAALAGAPAAPAAGTSIRPAAVNAVISVTRRRVMVTLDIAGSFHRSPRPRGWRRRTGIEPADDATRRPPVLKTGGATRHPDASGPDPTAQTPASHQLVLFGGGATTGTGFSNQTWSWNGTTWTQLHPGTSPSGRDSFAFVYNPATRAVVLFGGFRGTGYAPGDTWSWNGTTWTQLSPAASPGVDLFAWQAAYDPASHQVVLFGGDGGGARPFLNGTWAWTGSNWSPLGAAASPPGRAYGTLTYDGADQRVVLFAGSERALQVFPSTIWSWNGSTWSRGT